MKGKFALIILLLLISLIVFGQPKDFDTLKIDTITKIIGGAAAIGGFFLGYMQLRMANKIAEVEARFNAALTDAKFSFNQTIKLETEKLEAKFNVIQKEIENKMATRLDIDNLKEIIKMQHENNKISQENLKNLITDKIK